MVKTNHTTSTTSPHQTRSKSPKKKTVTTERRTSPRANKNTKKVLVNRPLQIQDTAICGGDPPSSSVAAAPPPPSVIYIVKDSLQLYRSKYGNKSFTHMESWKVLKHCPSFVSPTETTSRRNNATHRKPSIAAVEEESSIGDTEAIPNSYDSTALAGPIYGRDKSKRMEKLEKDKEKKEYRDRQLLLMYDEQGKELKNFAKLLANRASGQDRNTTQKSPIDVTVYHDNIKLLQSLGQKKKAQEMLMKVTEYLMCQELPSSNMSIYSVQSGSSYMKLNQSTH